VPRSLLAVLGLIALLALPAQADTKTAPHAVGFQAKVVSTSKRTKQMRARILTASGAGASRYKDRTMSFDLRGARLSVADTNGDGKDNTIADIKRNDIVGVNGSAPSGRRKSVKVAALTDLTALLQRPSLPGTPQLPG
jgi:hypothetical protein